MRLICRLASQWHMIHDEKWCTYTEFDTSVYHPLTRRDSRERVHNFFIGREPTFFCKRTVHRAWPDVQTSNSMILCVILHDTDRFGSRKVNSVLETAGMKNISIKNQWRRIHTITLLSGVNTQLGVLVHVGPKRWKYFYPFLTNWETKEMVL